MLFQLLLVLVVLIAIIMAIMRPKKLMSIHREIKVDFSYLPIIGHAYKFIGSNEDRMKLFVEIGRQTHGNKHGAVSFWFANQFAVSISDPVSLSFVLKTFVDKGPLTITSRHLLGNGSVFADEDIWRLRRKTLTPMFGSKYYNNFVKVFERRHNILMEELGAVVGKGDFSMRDCLNSCALDAALEMIFGEHVNFQKHDNAFITAFQEYCKNVAVRICQPWLYSAAVYDLMPVSFTQECIKKYIWDVIESLIQKRKVIMKEQFENNNERDHKNTQTKTFLEMLIEFSGGEDGYTDTELREETLVLVLAATDTSSTAAYSATVLLAQYPEIQDRIYEELCEQFEDLKKPITVNDLGKLKYLDAAAKEALRLYPPIPVTVRECKKDLTLPSGLILYKGCLVLVNFWGSNRNTNYWGADVDEFNPDRFLNASREQVNLFMPFGYGPRNCLGMKLAMASLKLYMAELTRRYRIAPATTYNSSKRTPHRLSFDMTLKHVDDFKLQLTNRC